MVCVGEGFGAWSYEGKVMQRKRLGGPEYVIAWLLMVTQG